MRETDHKVIDYERLRKEQLKNLDSLYDNLDGKLLDQSYL